MKKLIWFLALTLLILIIFLVVSNWGEIWKVVLALPYPWILCYLAGAATMFIAGTLSGDRTFKHKSE